MKEFTVIVWETEEDGERVYLSTTFEGRVRAERKIGHLYMNGIPFKYKRIPQLTTLEYIEWTRAELIRELAEEAK